MVTSIGRSEVRNDKSSDEVGLLLSDVVPEKVSWLWEGRIAMGKLTILDGDPGLGKSALLTDAAARVTIGRAWPDGTPCESGGVVLCSAEDGLADTIRPRLDAAGGDSSKVLALATVSDGNIERLVNIPKDLDFIRRGIERVGAKLLVVDPIIAFLDGDHNAHKDQDVRRALAPLAKLAEETGTALVCVRHLNKASGGNPLYRGGGSIGIVGAARSALVVAKDPNDDERRILAPLKSNLAKPVPSLAFVLSQAPNGAVRVEYKGTSTLAADALLASPPDPEERSALGEAKNFLLDALENGPRYNKAIKKEAHAADISDATLRRAKEALSVRANKEADGSWTWALPERVGAGREDTQGEQRYSQTSEDEPLEYLEQLPLDELRATIQRSYNEQQGTGPAQDEQLEPLVPAEASLSLEDAQDAHGEQAGRDEHTDDLVSRIVAVLKDPTTKPGQVFDSHRSSGFEDGHTPIVRAVAAYFGDTKNFTAWLKPTYDACDQIEAEA